MYHYKDLGLVNMNDMLAKAYKGGYAVPAFNFISIEQLNAIADACIALKSPVILIASPNLQRQLEPQMTARAVQGMVDRIEQVLNKSSVALHLDHGMSYDACTHAIKYGYSSVMIDGSPLPFSENAALTKKVVDYAHQHGISVEGELGALSGVEEEGHEGAGEASYTDPLMVQEFVQYTGVDCLAIAIGTSHGLVKIRPNADGSLPELRYDILEDVSRRIPGFPIVLHGASSIPEQYINMLNKYGGNIETAAGIPEEQVKKAAKMAICKINVASDGWIAALALTRKILAENPKAIDSRVFTLKVRPELAKLYERKIQLMGSQNKL